MQAEENANIEGSLEEDEDESSDEPDIQVKQNTCVLLTYLISASIK